MCKGSQGLDGFLTALGCHGWRLGPYSPPFPELPEVREGLIYPLVPSTH